MRESLARFASSTTNDVEAVSPQYGSNPFPELKYMFIDMGLYTFSHPSTNLYPSYHLLSPDSVSASRASEKYDSSSCCV